MDPSSACRESAFALDYFRVGQSFWSVARPQKNREIRRVCVKLPQHKNSIMDIRELVCSATVTLAASLTAFSAHANGIYVGGGVGSATIQDSPGNSAGTHFDENDAAWKAFGGYRFDVLPIVSLSAEIGYRDLGKPNASPGGVPVEYKLTGFDYAALAGVGLGPVEVYARIGGMQYDLKKTIGATETKFDGNAPVYGIGAQFMLFGIGVRAEYEKIDIKELDSVDMITLSAFYKF